LIDDLLAKYPNDVKVVIKNFPLGSHKQAKKAAQYALAAGKQGKYKEMYHKIFENYKQLKSNEDLPVTYAAELGIDVGKLKADVNDKSLSDLIDWEYNQLTGLRNAYPETDEYAAGVRLAVPKFFINGREPISRSIAAFSAMIEEEIKK
jgi:protein-disulfide isomerase